MKKLLIFLTVVFLLVTCKSNSSDRGTSSIENMTETPTFKLVGQELSAEDNGGLEFALVQEIAVDINLDQIIDTIFIERITKVTAENNKTYEWTDPGEFHQIKFIISGNKPKTFTNIEGWVNISSLLKYDKGFDDKSLIKSKYIIMRDAGNGNILTFLAGYSYASSPGLLTIINAYNGKDPKLVFNKNIELYGMKDFNNNGINDLITTVWEGYYNTKEDNLYRHKVYFLNGGFDLNPHESKHFCEHYQSASIP